MSLENGDVFFVLEFEVAIIDDDERSGG